jgi:hypothetical protein
MLYRQQFADKVEGQVYDDDMDKRKIIFLWSLAVKDQSSCHQHHSNNTRPSIFISMALITVHLTVLSDDVMKQVEVHPILFYITMLFHIEVVVEVVKRNISLCDSKFSATWLFLYQYLHIKVCPPQSSHKLLHRHKSIQSCLAYFVSSTSGHFTDKCPCSIRPVVTFYMK